MKIYNAFGITPTNTHLSAGSDYYIPNLNTPEKLAKAFQAFQKSYKISESDLNNVLTKFVAYFEGKRDMRKHFGNMIHLFFALYDPDLQYLKETDLYHAISVFCTDFLEYDEEKDVVGIALRKDDTLFINSGIKVALDTIFTERNLDLNDLGIGIGGLYVNKSGMGNKGFDVRACLVDRDYSGYVHLSVAYTKQSDEPLIVYCGDKLVQMMLIPIFHTEYEEISEDEYNELMSNSERGSDGFGSSDVKH